MTANDTIGAMEEGEASSAGLVPGRTCGYCTVCCYAPSIDTPELQKHASQICVNCTGRGCAIYDTRPEVCRTFHCGWRRWRSLDDDWRPDRSGVLILAKSDNVPEPYTGRLGCEFLVLGGEAAISRPGFVEKFLSLVASGRPMFISVPGPVGFTGAARFMNDILANAAKRNDRRAGLSHLLEAYRALQSYKFPPVTLKHAPVATAP